MVVLNVVYAGSLKERRGGVISTGVECQTSPSFEGRSALLPCPYSFNVSVPRMNPMRLARIVELVTPAVAPPMVLVVMLVLFVWKLSSAPALPAI